MSFFIVTDSIVKPTQAMRRRRTVKVGNVISVGISWDKIANILDEDDIVLARDRMDTWKMNGYSGITMDIWGKGKQGMSSIGDKIKGPVSWKE